LQESAFDDVVILFKELTKVLKINPSQVNPLTGDLKIPSIPKQIAVIYAIVCSKNASLVNQEIVSNMKTILDSSKTNIDKKVAFYIIGELGKTNNLTNNHEVCSLIEQVLKSGSEDVKEAAAICMGQLTLGNIKYFMPAILKSLGNGSDSVIYYMLVAIREIVSTDPGIITPYFNEILPVLIEKASSKENSVRNMVAECIGKSFISLTEILTQFINENIQSQNVFVKGTVLNAFTFIAVKNLQKVKELNNLLPNFINCMNSKDLKILEQVMISANSIAYYHPNLLRPHIDIIMPVIVRESLLKSELIYEVDMGAFKYKKDDGLVLRKACFQLIHTLTVTVSDKVLSNQILDRVKDALKNDESEEIQTICYMILESFAKMSQNLIIAEIEIIGQIIETKLNECEKKLKDKQDIEKVKGKINKIVHLLVKMSEIPGVDLIEKFQLLQKRLESNEEFASAKKEILK